MKQQSFTTQSALSMYLRVRKLKMVFILFLSLFSFQALYAEEACEIEKIHGQGFSTAISSVVENGDGSHTVSLLVSHDGCPGPGCKSLSHYSVEALPGTYSGIIIEVLSGSMTYGNIVLGPDLGVDPFNGFKIDNISGIGEGLAGEFMVSYTITGGLQNQQTLAKAGPDILLVGFSVEDFEFILDCNNLNIFPYYAPPAGGKIFNSLIGPELTSLYNTFTSTGTAVSDNIFRIDEQVVLIRVFALPGQLNSLANILTSSLYGMTDEIVIPELNAITGWFPITNLLMINSLENEVNYARPEYPPQSNRGLVTTQGDISMRSYIARDAFNLSGAGVKLGVLSDSYNKLFGNPANDDILKGDLPGIGIDPDGNLVPNPVNDTDVEVLKDYPYMGSDEGRAMLQIIHDIVPEANLAFRTGFINSVDFAQGIMELKDAGCNIIVDDITYITEPFFRDGLVAQAVNTVVAEGVTYFSAAGNFGSKSYENMFYPGDAPSGLPGVAHNFAGNDGYDIFQSISMEQGNYLIVMQWDDGSDPGTTNTDLDIYLTNNDGNTLFGFNRVNIGGDPIEVLPFTVGPGGAQANLVILKAEGAENVRFKYIVFRGQLTMEEYANVGNSTIVGQANAEGAIAVGAVLYSNTPEFGVDLPTIASFSSRGGTLIDGVDRQKPEITAPNGVYTTVDLGGFSFEGDLFPRFYGTSAAAPHAAGVAAFLFEARSKFYNNTISPAELREILTTTALDMDGPGYDPASGFGFIQADAALLTLANPSPLILGLAYDTTLMPGYDSILITITGKYLTDGSKIYFNGEELESETIIVDDSVAMSIVPPFEELYPAIQVYNPPMAQTNGTDGGLSNSLYFTSKEIILITIDNKNKKYGEILPEFTASYSVESLDGSSTLTEAGLTEDEIARILSIPFEALNVTPLSNSGLWAITPSLSDPLNPLSGVSPTEVVDQLLLERFEFRFVNGFLDIESLDLLVKPQDATFIYGEPVEGIQFDYVFNDDPDDPLSIPEEVNTQILSLLQTGHATALVNGKATALVNTPATALANRSFMISATALVNSTDLIDVTFENPDLLFDSVALANGLATALVNGHATALVNARALVTGQATALVNGQATALVNAATIGQATALVNTTTVNATSNKEAVIMLTEEDIYILAGIEEGEITLFSMNLIPDNSAGTYWLLAGTLITNNFNVTYEPGTITFLPAPADVRFLEESLTQTYNGNPLSPVVITEPEGLEVEVTYEGLTEAPVNAGVYQIIATVTDPNYVGSASSVFTIDQASLIVSIEDTYIYAGDPLPEFNYIFAGFVNNEDESVLTSLSYSISPDYLGSAGTYQITPQASAMNYHITTIDGILYVNPSGPGTMHIIPKLLCVEQISPYEGYSYIAHFGYINNNNVGVYVPIGPDNFLNSVGNYDGTALPQYFLPGNHSFYIPFDGTELTWTIASFNGGGQKVTLFRTARHNSPACNKSEALNGFDESVDDYNVVRIYPNPASNRVYLKMEEKRMNSAELRFFDVLGNQVPVEVSRTGGDLMEISLAGVRAGVYFIQVKNSRSAEIFRIVKH